MICQHPKARYSKPMESGVLDFMSKEKSIVTSVGEWE